MKKIIKKVARATGRALAVLAGMIMLYIGCAFLLSRIAVNKNAAPAGAGPVSIYIKTNGVHTDIVVPVKNEIQDWAPLLKAISGPADTTWRYVAFGWGDKGFYLQTPEWSDLKFSVAFKAMFHLGTSALHITRYRQMVTGKDCKEIKIDVIQYRKLVGYLMATFRRDTTGGFIPIVSEHDGYGDNDAFYEANGVYDLFHTCNTWANNALKACGQRACLWTPSDKGIFYQYRDR